MLASLAALLALGNVCYLLVAPRHTTFHVFFIPLVLLDLASLATGIALTSTGPSHVAAHVRLVTWVAFTGYPFMLSPMLSAALGTAELLYMKPAHEEEAI